jgi:hypothetical protein
MNDKDLIMRLRFLRNNAKLSIKDKDFVRVKLVEKRLNVLIDDVKRGVVNDEN